jgi:hypothetical protein
MMRLAQLSLVAGPLAGCEAAARPAKLVADLHGSLLYKREPMRVYLGARSAQHVTAVERADGDDSQPRSAKVGSQVGRSVPRLEGRDKVTGRAEYTHTMRLPGMLLAKIFRSTVAHGRIKSIDTSAAKQVPGVLHVVTIDDVRKVIPDPYYGPAFHDQPILADEKVRFVGEPVAAVIAADPHVADEAVQLITAEYEELPAIFDEVEAATSKVYVHDQLKPAGAFADLKHLKGIKNTNVALDYRLRRGDFDKAYAAAAHKFEHEFRTQKALHLSFEPFATIADYKDTGVTLHSSSQGPSFVRIEIARLLGWPENRVRIKVPYLGSGYGSKLYIKLEALGARALHDRAPTGEGRAHHGGDVLSDHQASEHVPHQDRRRQGRPDRRAQVRGVLERRRLCRHRSARDAEGGPDRGRSPTTSTMSGSTPTRSTPT